MLPTFVIGLREGLEAALIVGIIAAFLRKQSRSELLRWVFVGVGVAVLLCLAVGVTLDQLSKDLPQRQQEGLETVIGALAVCMVTYMVIWMRRHSRDLKGQLEGLAAEALHGTSRAARAMVAMAFLAVLREGFETVVFLLAAFNESGSGSSAVVGAVLGILVAVGLGHGIYRGGVRLNLSKFFRGTGLVLVLVAAGLVVNALRTAHEAGWLDAGQGRTVDLTWLVRPGSVQSSLLTGMLGVQSRPVVIEVIGWFAYLIPVGLYVAWPPGRSMPTRLATRTLAGFAVVAGLACASLAVLAPSAPTHRPLTHAGTLSAQVISEHDSTAIVRTRPHSPAAGAVADARDVAVQVVGSEAHAGLTTMRYTATTVGASAAALPSMLGADRIAQLNGGRLPIGLRLAAGQSAPVTYVDRNVLTVWVEPRTGRVVDLRWDETVRATVTGSGGARLPLSLPVATGSDAMPANFVAAASAAARPHLGDLDERDRDLTLARVTGVLAGLALLGAAGFAGSAQRTGFRREQAHDGPVTASV